MDAMITTYSAVLCSPSFVTLEEKPGPLDDHALASRLSYFLWNSEPDMVLRSLADRGALTGRAANMAFSERTSDPMSGAGAQTAHASANTPPELGVGGAP